MIRFRFGRLLAVSASAWAIWTAGAAIAAEPATSVRVVQPSRTVADVTLDSKGTLAGQVIDAQGTPVAGAAVVVSRANKTAGRGVTQRDGTFRVAGLSGGVYQVTSADGQSVCRAWTAKTAPPAARSSLLVVSGSALRAQHHIGDIIRSDGFIVGSVIVAAVAIPVAIHNLDDEDGS